MTTKDRFNYLTFSDWNALNICKVFYQKINVKIMNNGG